MKKIIGLLVVFAIVLYGAYEALVYYDNNFRYGRMRQTPAVRPHEEPLLVMEAGLVPIDGGEAVYRTAEGDSLKAPIELSDATVLARGKGVYATFCIQCHGLNHDGKGTVGQSFAPLPMDLRDPKVQSKHEGELFKSISYGVPDGRQPPLETTITIDDRWRVVAYVKSLGLRY